MGERKRSMNCWRPLIASSVRPRSTRKYLILLGMVVATTAHAGESLTLDQAVDRAMKGNPTLAAAGYETVADFERPAQAASLPDPSFMVQFSQVPINTFDVDRGMTEYMVQQTIPFPGKLVYGYEAEKRAAEGTQAMETMTAQEIIRAVTHAYANAWMLQQERAIERRTLARFRENKGTAETAYAANARPVADPVRAAVDAGEVEGRL